MKKGIFLLICLLLVSLLALPASAAEPSYDFRLSANGQDTLEVTTGDTITVSLHLRRSSPEAAYSMYGMQAELRYDGSFLELIPDSGAAHTGVVTQDIAVDAPHREYYMNYLSLSGGTQWDADTLVGTAQFRVTGTSGVTKITNEDFLVSLPDGSGCYECSSNELLLILSTDCTVRFQTNGGTELAPVTAIFGEKLPRPDDPIRAGYHLTGWFRDIHLSDEWDFENDTVQGNMTLYARWEAGDPVAGTGGICLLWLLILLLLLLLLLIYLLFKRRRKKEE